MSFFRLSIRGIKDRISQTANISLLCGLLVEFIDFRWKYCDAFLHGIDMPVYHSYKF